MNQHTGTQMYVLATLVLAHVSTCIDTGEDETAEIHFQAPDLADEFIRHTLSIAKLLPFQLRIDRTAPDQVLVRQHPRPHDQEGNPDA